MKRNSTPVLLSLLILIASDGLVLAQSATPVTINFDELPAGTIVANQYVPKVYFSPTNFRAGPGVGQFANDLYALAYPSPFSNRAISGLNHFCNCFPGGFETYISFTVPVNNLSFNILNFRNSYNQPAAYIDIYVNHSYYNYGYVYGTLNQGTIPVTFLRTIPDITDIKIYYTQNYDQFGQSIPLYHDDFAFTPDFSVSITNSRISGSLNGLTQYALVGGDIVLDTSISPTGRSGGSYLWTMTGPYTVVSGSTTSSSLTIRPTDVGTVTASVTYTLNGFTATGLVTINSLLPTLSSLSATAAANVLDRAHGCSNQFFGGATYTMDCYQNGQEKGILWSATATIPSHTYLTDPAYSGIKFKQGVNLYRKRLNNGRIECKTLRNPQSDLPSGWALDSSDPYNHSQHPARFFDQANPLSMSDFDAPGDALDGTIQATPPSPFFYDSKFNDDHFELYVFYFTGAEASAPTFEYSRPLHLTNSQFLTDRVEWNWGGTVYFDADNSPSRYREQSSTTRTGVIPATGTNQIVSLQRVATGSQPPWALCSGAVDTHNPIDGSRFFINQQYSDLLSFQPDAAGWDFWTAQITRCVFDTNCIYGIRNPGAFHGKRTDVAKAFFDAAPFNQSDPDMRPPGSPGYNQVLYNTAFVKYCYYKYFQRLPDQGGLDYWVNNLNSTSDYLGVIDAFINGYEYRVRFGPMDPHY